MNTKEVRSMVDMIRDAGNKELVIVSLFLLPLLLGAWSIFLNSLGFLDQHDGWKLLIICFLLALYVVGLIYMKTADTQEDKLQRARYHIETKLKKRGGHRASFDAIRMIVAKKDDQDVDVLKRYSAHYKFVDVYPLRPGVDLTLLVRKDLADKDAKDLYKLLEYETPK